MRLTRRHLLQSSGALLIGSLLAPASFTVFSQDQALFEPPDGRIYHGTSPTPTAVDGYVAALGDEGIFPLIEGTHMSIPGTRPQNFQRNIDSFLARTSAANRVPHLSLGFNGPDGSNDVEIATGSSFDNYIEDAARLVRDYDKPLFVRLGFEFNGSWNGYEPYQYVLAFRKIVDRFRAAGVENAAYIWCYEPDAADDFDVDINASVPKWYPGDDYVDWFGLDVFNSSHFSANTEGGSRGNSIPFDRASKFLTLASERAKPVILSETAAINAHITPDAEDPGLVDGEHDWNLWFDPFFDWLEEHPEIKAWLYMNQNYLTDYGGHYYENNNWGDCRFEVNSFIRQRYVQALQSERFINQPEGLVM